MPTLYISKYPLLFKKMDDLQNLNILSVCRTMKKGSRSIWAAYLVYGEIEFDFIGIIAQTSANKKTPIKGFCGVGGN